MGLYINWLYIFIPILGLLANIIFQIIIFRSFDLIGLLKTIFMGFTFGFCVSLMGEFVLYSQFPSNIPGNDFYALIIVNFIIYSFLGFIYFNLNGLGETARRIRILTEFYENNGLTLDELLSRYSARDMIHNRLARLARNKQIKFKNNRYFISNPDMLLLSKFIVFMKIFLLGKPSEYQKLQ